MNEFLARLKQRKLVQWTLAYIAAAFALIQVIDVASDSYEWPHLVMHLVFGVLALGFVVALVLAWYHGERGAQRISGPELLLIALALAIAGGLLWHFGRAGSPVAPANVATKAPTGAIATRSPDGAQRNPGNTTPDSAAKAASSGLLGDAVAQPIPSKSIAVLPFENLSTDKGNAYFADGIQDLILTKLADIGDLKVISRTSTESYGSHPGNLKSIGQQLGVATILEGSVQKAGNQVLINVQLIDASTDSHVWAQSYQRTLDNIFGIEGEVADKVAKSLSAKLTAVEAARVAAIPTTNAAAYDAYLRGEYHMTNFDRGEMKPDVAAAVREYSAAIRQDSGFALAWARLANAQVFLAGMTYDDPALGDKLQAQAKTSIAKALALQPDLVEAYVSQGIYDLFVSGDWHAALVAFNKAHALQPHNAKALWFIAYTLRGLGETPESMRVLRQLHVVDPKRAPTLLGAEEAYLHRFANAERIMKRALAIDPDSWTTLDSLASLYAYLGDLPSMGRLIENAPASIKANPNFTDTVGDYLIYRRDWDAARKLFAQAQEPQNLHAAFYPVEIRRGDIEWYAGNPAGSREQYQLAATLLRTQLQQQPKNPRWHAELGWVYARLGHAGEALQQGRLALGPEAATAGVVLHSPGSALALARIQAQVGKARDAVAILDTLLAEPTGTAISVPLLEMDPTWDPIRHDPRFDALLKKYASATPAEASTSGATLPAVASGEANHG